MHTWKISLAVRGCNYPWEMPSDPKVVLFLMVDSIDSFGDRLWVHTTLRHLALLEDNRGQANLHFAVRGLFQSLIANNSKFLCLVSTCFVQWMTSWGQLAFGHPVDLVWHFSDHWLEAHTVFTMTVIRFSWAYTTQNKDFTKQHMFIQFSWWRSKDWNVLVLLLLWSLYSVSYVLKKT